MNSQPEYIIELHLMGVVKVIGGANKSDDIQVGSLSVDLGKVAQLMCQKEDFYLPEPRGALKRVNLDNAIEVGVCRTAAFALDMIEGRLSGEALADAVKSGKLDTVSVRGEMTSELVEKLDSAGLRPIMQLAATSVN
ncbi:MAG: hypothetical protein KJZ73_00055 [Pseudorhodoplanes sp.]|nr:hypothetical protein [Pseudorhodoplanes sp.]